MRSWAEPLGQECGMAGLAATGLKHQDPRNFGRYEVTGLLGSGSCGRVYSAHDPLLDRPVALKVLQPHLAAQVRAAYLARFKLELRVFGRVSHPLVVSIFDACLTGESPYLVMELCSGPNLARWLARVKRVPAGQAALIFYQAAMALDHIHGLGIVHRDVKPANLLFHHRTLKLTDFGIASADFLSDERTGAVEGSPGYLSPEQYAGDEVTHRSDLFSLGAVFFELLSGRPPFFGDPRSAQYGKLFDVPPSVTSSAPDLTPEFDSFFNQALARDPRIRFDSGAAMCQALSKIVPEHQLEAFARVPGPGHWCAAPPPTCFRYGRIPRPSLHSPPEAPRFGPLPSGMRVEPPPGRHDDATSGNGVDTIPRGVGAGSGTPAVGFGAGIVSRRLEAWVALGVLFCLLAWWVGTSWTGARVFGVTGESNGAVQEAIRSPAPLQKKDDSGGRDEGRPGDTVKMDPRTAGGEIPRATF